MPGNNRQDVAFDPPLSSHHDWKKSTVDAVVMSSYVGQVYPGASGECIDEWEAQALLHML